MHLLIRSYENVLRNLIRSHKIRIRVGLGLSTACNQLLPTKIFQTHLVNASCVELGPLKSENIGAVLEGDAEKCDQIVFHMQNGQFGQEAEVEPDQGRFSRKGQELLPLLGCQTKRASIPDLFQTHRVANATYHSDVNVRFADQICHGKLLLLA